MTIVHIVLFKFRADVDEAIREEFLSQIKTLKDLPCVKSQRLVVGGPSITTPIEKSKGFQYGLVSYHENRAALDEYQASSEHHRINYQPVLKIGADMLRPLSVLSGPIMEIDVSTVNRVDEAVKPVALAKAKGGSLSDEDVKIFG